MGCGLFLRFILLFEFVVLLMGWVWVLLVVCRYFGFLLVVVLLFWLWFMLVLHFPCFLVLGGGLAVDDWWLGGRLWSGFPGFAGGYWLWVIVCEYFGFLVG